ncbi:MAG: putative baseplate assembly protein [Crocosphaera sp.]|nr:putative baseplate assembly protein [Crocosphaera sp.]
MVNRYSCQNELRRRLARTQPGVDGQYVNGIDYLEVASEQTQKILTVHLLQTQSPLAPLTADNIEITDDKGNIIPPELVNSFGKLITIGLDAPNRPFPFYNLRLVESPLTRLKRGYLERDDPPPPQGFDPQLCQIQFSLPSQPSQEFDCKVPEPVSQLPTPPPVIDYLAKDYASFRQLMLDRLTVTMPQWKERSPADIGIMLVEILAYVGDQLSYYQDAVATEAYLGTARKRVSVRRHARLLDYFLHDGSNARTWVAIAVKGKSDEKKPFNPKTDGIKLLGPSVEDHRPGTRFLTRSNQLPVVLRPQDPQDPKKKYDQILIDKALNTDIEVFESLHDITLFEPCNTLYFYTWGEDNCSLPKGATKATLKDSGGKLQQCLEPGRVLILEEKLNPDTGQPTGVDLSHRHAIRLLKVTPKEDPLIPEETEDKTRKQKQRLVEIQWYPEDALPFQLCISKRIEGKLYNEMAIAEGNVVLVDHGRTRTRKEPITADNLETAKETASVDSKILDEQHFNKVPSLTRYRPHLKYGPLTQQSYTRNQQGEWVLVDPKQPAREALGWLAKGIDPSSPSQQDNLASPLATKDYPVQEVAREALAQKRRFLRPSIALKEYSTQEFTWIYQPDLLNSDRFDRHFMVETEEDGRAYLRFGDDFLGKRPEVGTYLQVTYRTGNGTQGNVGAEAIAHIITEEDRIDLVRNPLPAQGGIPPESLEQVRLYAPQAFRVPQRAVTESDYEQIAQRYPGVQRVKATRRWTGSWHTLFLTVDRQGDRPIDEAFKQDLRGFLEPFRLAGHDLEIEAPRLIPLWISLKVQVQPNYFPSTVKGALLETFSNRVLSNGQLGFFHSDQLTFGQTIYLSQVIKTAVEVEGVQSVQVIRFQRWGQEPQGEINTGQITFGPLEIAQLNNDPANPSQGQIEFEMEGGL